MNTGQTFEGIFRLNKAVLGIFTEKAIRKSREKVKFSFGEIRKFLALSVLEIFVFKLYKKQLCVCVGVG